MISPRPFTVPMSGGLLALGGRTRIMGVLNVTPDSFSDGGAFLDADAAIAHGRQMAAHGADLIDIGGESTRPGSDPTPPAEQIRRTVPVVAGLRSAGVTLPVSIDTQSAEVAEAVLAAGANIVNDISALRSDPRMAACCAARGAAVVLMHMQGTPHTMQQAPTYSDVVAEVTAFLAERIESVGRAGIDRARIIVDPGIGFGKTYEHNLLLLRNLHALAALDQPILAGPSRKAFLGRITGESDPSRRDIATAAATALCAVQGAQIVRVHNVAMMRTIVNVCAAVTGITPPPP